MQQPQANIRDVWKTFYGDQVPLGYLLRESKRDVWLRIHSLPESRRYARHEGETEEILHRYNMIADEVLGEGSSCVWFVPHYALQAKSSTFGLFVGDWFCDYREEGTHITLFAGVVSWRHQAFDSVLRLVADDGVRYVSWMNVQSGEIFAPYDGGADLFLNSTPRRDELREKYEGWLSKHPQGL